MRLLVTGGAGYIGSLAVRLFLSQGHEVWVYDNLSAGHRPAVPTDRLIVAELADGNRLDRALKEHRIEAVVHFAAFARTECRPDAGERFFEILMDIVAERFERRDIKHSGFVPQVARETVTKQSIQGGQERSQRLA